MKGQKTQFRAVWGTILVKEIDTRAGDAIYIVEERPWLLCKVVAVGEDIDAYRCGDLIRCQPDLKRQKHRSFFWQGECYIKVEPELIFLRIDSGRLYAVGKAVMLSPCEDISRMDGSIRLPDSMQESYQRSRVISAGLGVYFVKKGDIVLHKRYDFYKYFRYSGMWIYVTLEENLLALQV